MNDTDAELLGRAVAELRTSLPEARVVGVLGGTDLAREVVEDLAPGPHTAP